MKTNIPDSVFPTELSENNAITTSYTTNTLIPRPGPLLLAPFVRLIPRLIEEYQSAADLLKDSQTFEKQYETKLEITSSKINQSIFNKLSQQESFKSNIKSNITKLQKTLKKKSNNTNTLLPTSALFSNFTNRPSIPNIPALHITDNEDNDTQTDHTPQSELIKTADETILLKGFAQPNAIIGKLSEKKLLQDSGKILSSQIQEIGSNPQLKLIEFLLDDNTLPNNQELEEFETLFDLAISNHLPTQNQNSTSQLIQQDSSFKKLFMKYSWQHLNQVFSFKDYLFPIKPNQNKGYSEWAFQRSEKLTMQLGTPEFKGPISTESLTPNSELSVSESLNISDFSGQNTLQTQSNARSESQSSSLSTRFQHQLSNMTEEGMQDEAEFSKTSLLVNSLREQRRASINHVINQLSRENQSVAYSQKFTTSNASREYTSRGVDSDQAMTELAFQVSTPVDVSIKLDAVNLAWCPRIASPFLDLHRLVINHGRKSLTEFLTQNKIPDPLEPIFSYDTKEDTKEDTVTVPNLLGPIPFEFSFEMDGNFKGWELDTEHAGVTQHTETKVFGLFPIKHDHADAHIDFITFNGSKVNVKVILNTNYNNSQNSLGGHPTYSTFSFYLPFRKLDESTRLAFKEYAVNQQETRQQRGAIKSKARQYAHLRKEELIDRYANEYDLKEEVFRALVRQVFSDESQSRHSYYLEILRSYIDWEHASIRMESASIDRLAYPDYPADHFMNAPAARLILPINKTSESSFFDLLEASAGPYYRKTANETESIIKNYRKTLETFKTSTPEKLVLDQYKSELVLGKHYEAVLSKSKFSED